ncbi:MAG TPA: carboxypeptidase-like regulatory domain-containing protein [Thermoguttaceae bacterium]|nr:carboxypeptidase-like regulatory domain-containing protein [Thermoguttaceae bacterium]
MRVSSILRSGVVAIACLGLLLPQAAFAAQQQAQAPKGHPPISILDVALGPQGTLYGAVVDPQGAPVAATPVALLCGKGVVGVAKTDPQGRFAFSNLRRGVYGVGAAGVVRACRVWAPRTAPPAANQGVLIVSDGQLVRGRGPMRDSQGRVYQWMSENYLLTWCAIAATIAVPVAVVSSQQRGGPSSP